MTAIKDLEVEKDKKSALSDLDNIAKLLYHQSGKKAHIINEMKLCNEVEAFWQKLSLKLESKSITQEKADEALSKLDAWISNKLSGESYYRLLKKIEKEFPEFIKKMPLSIAARYEEMKVARIWSMMLDPESLYILNISIGFEVKVSKAGEE